MSVHICLRRRNDLKDHPVWERECEPYNGGHKHFVRNVMYGLPVESVRTNDSQYDFDWLERPTDFDAWRDAISKIEDVNPNLFTMLEILKAEPDYWIYVSQ